MQIHHDFNKVYLKCVFNIDLLKALHNISKM